MPQCPIAGDATVTICFGLSVTGNVCMVTYLFTIVYLALPVLFTS